MQVIYHRVCITASWSLWRDTVPSWAAGTFVLKGKQSRRYSGARKKRKNWVKRSWVSVMAMDLVCRWYFYQPVTKIIKESYQAVQGAGIVRAGVGLVGWGGMPCEAGNGAVAVGAFLGRGGFLLVGPNLLVKIPWKLAKQISLRSFSFPWPDELVLYQYIAMQ